MIKLTPIMGFELKDNREVTIMKDWKDQARKKGFSCFCFLNDVACVCRKIGNLFSWGE